MITGRCGLPECLHPSRFIAIEMEQADRMDYRYILLPFAQRLAATEQSRAWIISGVDLRRNACTPRDGNAGYDKSRLKRQHPDM